LQCVRFSIAFVKNKKADHAQDVLIDHDITLLEESLHDEMELM
jgi:hypothetical protein